MELFLYSRLKCLFGYTCCWNTNIIAQTIGLSWKLQWIQWAEHYVNMFFFHNKHKTINEISRACLRRDTLTHSVKGTKMFCSWHISNSHQLNNLLVFPRKWIKAETNRKLPALSYSSLKNLWNPVLTHRRLAEQQTSRLIQNTTNGTLQTWVTNTPQ